MCFLTLVVSDFLHVRVCVCVISICLCLNKCMRFQTALHKRQSRVYQKPHSLPPKSFHLPGEIAYPLNLSTRCSIQSKLPFVHKDVTRRCMKNISGFITLSDISAHPCSSLFLFFRHSFPFWWAAGWRNPREEKGGRCRLDVAAHSWDGRGWSRNNSRTAGGAWGARGCAWFAKVGGG